MTHPIDIARHINLEELPAIFAECKPRVLVVTDDGLNTGTDSFGISQFVRVLQGVSVHGMFPTVEARPRGDNDEAFNDLTIDKFDIVFLFGNRPLFDAPFEPFELSKAAHDRIARFMQDGGGAFATGDHAADGAGMCGGLPRIRNMRYWALDETPGITDDSRLTTIRPGDDKDFDWSDQVDAHPQRLYANFDIPADVPVVIESSPTSPVRRPHPLLRMSDGSALDIYPDHTNEGECRLPDNLSTTFDLAGTDTAEWPRAEFFGSPQPRHVASSMSHGNGFNLFGVPRQPVVPRSFIAIAAYNGQPMDVGRVVTDSSYYHYINLTVRRFSPPDEGRLHQYWANLVNWLMPARARKCLLPLRIFRLLLDDPIARKIRLPATGAPEAPELLRIGAVVAGSLDRTPGAGADEVLEDIIALVVDVQKLAEVANPEATDLSEPARNVALTVLGASALELARRAANGDLSRTDDAFDAIVKSNAGYARDVLSEHRAGLMRDQRIADCFEKCVVG